MYVQILAIDDEPLTNYAPEDLRLTLILADCCYNTPGEVLRFAILALWEARWTPGSIAWRVFRDDGTPLPIGENYGLDMPPPEDNYRGGYNYAAGYHD
jgi:hypothetical protein